MVHNAAARTVHDIDLHTSQVDRQTNFRQLRQKRQTSLGVAVRGLTYLKLDPLLSS